MRLTRSVVTSVSVFAIVACAGAKDSRPNEGPARYLYVWAGTGHDTTNGLDMMTVLDADPASAKYGSVIAALTVDSSGRMPHHSELTLPAKGPLFANDYMADKTFLVDFSTPQTPKLVGTLPAVPGGRRVHSFERLPNGHILATVQFGDSSLEGNPGRLAEFDAQGQFVRSASSSDSAFRGAHIRTYGIAVVPALDRVVTTSSPMDNEMTANVVQVWRLSDLSLLKTLDVPKVQGDSAERMPFEARTLGDNTVLVNSYACGFYRISNLSAEPTIERVLMLPEPRNVGCSVPVIAGRFMVMPIAYAHRFATIDIGDPAHPREVASFETDSTFFPHWASADPRSDRLVFTDQGDGLPKVMIAHFDRSTGRLTWDNGFKDAGNERPGVSFHRAKWPNGVTGMAMPHGAVFVP